MRLLLLLLILTICGSCTDFSFDVALLCGLRNRKYFKYIVKAFDEDVFSAPDQIGPTVKGVYETMDYKDIEIKGGQSYDEMFSSGYSIRFQIWHTCTKKKGGVYLNVNGKRPCTTSSFECRAGFHMDLTNKEGSISMHFPIFSYL